MRPAHALGAAPAALFPAARLAALPRHASVLPLLLAAALYAGLWHGLGGFPLFDVDEGAFSEATREMLERGDFVTTYLNGKLRFDKPILTYWLQAGAVALFGVREFAFRLPSALAATGWVAAVLVFMLRRADRGTAYAAALIAATTLGMGLIGRGATADALLNLFLALALFDVYRYLEDPRGRYKYRAWLWMSLGLLTKGPVALLIPGAVSLLVFLVHGRMRQWREAVLDPRGWLILLAVAGPWYALEYAAQGQAFLSGFFLRHNVERFVTPLQGHRGSAWYYAPAVLLLLLPYSGLLLRVLPRVRDWRRTPLDTFLWAWFLFVLAFFTLAGTKLPHYLLYGTTPLFILMARHRHLLRSRALAFVPPLLLLGFIAALPWLLQHGGPAIGNGYYRDMLTRGGVFGPAYHALAWGLLLAVLGLACVRGPRLWPRLAGAGVACAFALGALALPALGELQQGPVRQAALVARQYPDVVAWRFNAPSFSVYRGRVTPWVEQPAPGQVVLTRADRLDGLPGAQVLYRNGGVVLARMGR